MHNDDPLGRHRMLVSDLLYRNSASVHKRQRLHEDDPFILHEAVTCPVVCPLLNARPI